MAAPSEKIFGLFLVTFRVWVSDLGFGSGLKTQKTPNPVKIPVLWARKNPNLGPDPVRSLVKTNKKYAG